MLDSHLNEPYRTVPSGWLWQKLGIGYKPTTHPMLLEQKEGLSDGYLTIAAHVLLPLRERLRVLLTGRMIVEFAIRSDVTIKRCEFVTSVSVMPWKY